ncbi:DUF4383 domain-containing protein [Mycolicibacterium aichiense]|uniref:DUF4383 domain-containing protein n=1 Tax=Mycolicibacterium aichiense TaxID=1799 RepID=UPI003D672B6E
MGRWTSGLRLVSRNPGHFRRGRWFLLAEGLLLIALGAAGFISAATHPGYPPVGAPVLVLALTPWHSAVLLGFGVLAVVGTLHRRAAVVVTGMGAAGFLILLFIGAVTAAHHAPGPLGFNARDIVLHGVIAAANFAILYWLIPDALEGPDWEPRPGTRTHDGSTPSPPASAADTGAGRESAPALPGGDSRRKRR